MLNNKGNYKLSHIDTQGRIAFLGNPGRVSQLKHRPLRTSETQEGLNLYSIAYMVV